MKCYNYAPRTGEYTGEEEAFEDPKAPGRYLLPGRATWEKPPPKAGLNPDSSETSVWDGTKWVITEDHRGRKGYVGGAETEIKNLGPLPEGWSDNPPPEEPNAALKRRIIIRLNEIDGLMARSTQGILLATLNDTPPEADDVNYFNAYLEEKIKLREKLLEVDHADI